MSKSDHAVGKLAVRNRILLSALLLLSVMISVTGSVAQPIAQPIPATTVTFTTTSTASGLTTSFLTTQTVYVVPLQSSASTAAPIAHTPIPVGGELLPIQSINILLPWILLIGVLMMVAIGSLTRKKKKVD